MKQTIRIPVREKVVCLAADIVYGQRQEWCEAKYRQLRLSLMKPRCHYPNDETRDYPLLVWLCGGSFAEVDRNVWMPELVYFAKRGYAVASVEYGVTSLTRFPEQLEDVKLAIRYLRAHAKELHIQPEHVAVMGESAGGYLSALTGLTGRNRAFDRGEYQDQSSDVQAVVTWYACTDTRDLGDPNVTHCPPDTANYPVLMDLVTSGAPPMLLMHGTADTLVNCQQSEMLYDALQKANVESSLYLLEGANHADHPFAQDQCKAIMLEFLDRKLK